MDVSVGRDRVENLHALNGMVGRRVSFDSEPMKNSHHLLFVVSLGVSSFAPFVHAAEKPVEKASKPDYSLLEKLPDREIAAKKTAHTGWDSGVTSKMLDATTGYTEALTGMVADLAATYYGKAKVTKEEVASYVKTLKAAADFRHRLDNPTNEDRGSMDALEAPSVVSSDLEDTIDQMVQAVTDGDEHFDYEKWEKRWDEARKTGDAAAPEETPEADRGEKTVKPNPTEDSAKDTPSTKRDKAD